MSVRKYLKHGLAVLAAGALVVGFASPAAQAAGVPAPSVNFSGNLPTAGLALDSTSCVWYVGVETGDYLPAGAFVPGGIYQVKVGAYQKDNGYWLYSDPVTVDISGASTDTTYVSLTVPVATYTAFQAVISLVAPNGQVIGSWTITDKSDALCYIPAPGSL